MNVSLKKMLRSACLGLILLSPLSGRAQQPMVNHSYTLGSDVANNVHLYNGDTNDHSVGEATHVTARNTTLSDETNFLEGNWFNCKTGDWELSIFGNSVIHDNKLWTYKHLAERNEGVLELSREGDRISLPYLYKKGKLYFGSEPDRKVLSKEARYTNVPKPTNPPAFIGPVFKMDTAVLNGYLYGHGTLTGNSTFTLYFNNTLAGEQQTYLIKVDSDGFFSIKLPLAYPSLYWTTDLGSAKLLLSPAEETFVLLDLSKKSSPLVMGANGRISTELSQKDLNVKTFDYPYVRSKILDMSAQDFKTYCLQIQAKGLKALDSIYKDGTISHRYYQYMKLDIAGEVAQNILSYPFTYNDVYRSKHNIRDKPLTLPAAPKQPEYPAYYDFIKEELVTNEISLIPYWFDCFFNEFKNIPLFKGADVEQGDNLLMSLSKLGIDLPEDEMQLLYGEKLREEENKEFFDKNANALFDFQKDNVDLFNMWYENDSLKDTISFWEYLKANKTNFTTAENVLLEETLRDLRSPNNQKATDFFGKNGAKLNKLYSTYASEIAIVSSSDQVAKWDSVMVHVLGISSTLSSDLFLTQAIVGYVSKEMTPLNDRTLDYAVSHFKNPFFADYVRAVNKATIKKVNLIKDSKVYVAHDELTRKADLIFEDIVGGFKNKVVFVDFWATWCGPCRMDMNDQREMKNALIKAGKDVVFVYITNHTSPKETYINLIQQIPGEHFRVDADQWNYLSRKFTISGIPHYVLVNRKGEIVDPNAPREVSALKNRLDELLDEKKNVE